MDIINMIDWLTAKRLYKEGVSQKADFYWDMDNEYDDNPEYCDGKIRPKSAFELDENGIPKGIGNGIYAAFNTDNNEPD